MSNDESSVIHKQAVLSLVKTLGANGRVIAGREALGVAFLLHRHGLDSRCQWGNAYFRCHACGQARDCDGSEDWYDREDHREYDTPLCGGYDENCNMTCFSITLALNT